MQRPEETAQNSARGWRRRGMASVFAVLPSVLLLGLLAPDLVRVVAAQVGGIAAPSERPPYRFQPPDKTPLLVPRDYSAGFMPELFDLQRLFSHTSFAPSRSQLSRIAAFAPTSGETIAIDDVDAQAREVLFDDVLAAATVPASDLGGLGPFLPLGDPTPRGNGQRFDDFPGGAVPALGSVPIPEPSTGLLLAAGCIALAYRRRL